MAWRSLSLSKSLEHLIFGSPWCLTSARCVSSFSAGSLVQELTRSVALSPSLSWISPECQVFESMVKNADLKYTEQRLSNEDSTGPRLNVILRI
jgi:hypothetical protein